MAITINKNNISRFTKRLKKALQKQGLDLPLNQVQELAAQSLGQENYHTLHSLLENKHEQSLVLDNTTSKSIVEQLSIINEDNNENLPILSEGAKNIHIPSFDKYAWFIEEAGLQIGASMGRLGSNIGKEHITNAVKKSLHLLLSKSPRVEITLNEALNLIECFGGDSETSITLSRFKHSNNNIYPCFKDSLDNDFRFIDYGLYAWFSEYPEEGCMYLEDLVEHSD